MISMTCHDIHDLSWYSQLLLSWYPWCLCHDIHDIRSHVIHDVRSHVIHDVRSHVIHDVRSHDNTDFNSKPLRGRRQLIKVLESVIKSREVLKSITKSRKRTISRSCTQTWFWVSFLQKVSLNNDLLRFPTFFLTIWILTQNETSYVDTSYIGCQNILNSIRF